MIFADIKWHTLLQFSQYMFKSFLNFQKTYKVIDFSSGKVMPLE